MSSTTYDHFAITGKMVTKRHHFVDVNKMYAAQEQFRHVTKMVCGRLRDLTKTYHLGAVTAIVRNAGQLPQPFWLGAACGGGSCSAATVPARA